MKTSRLRGPKTLGMRLRWLDNLCFSKQEVIWTFALITCQRGDTEIYFLKFISLQDLLGFINWVNIFEHPHCRYASMVGWMRWNQYFSVRTHRCVCDGRNNIRFIRKCIGIYWKISIISIKISPGSLLFNGVCKKYMTWPKNE